MSATIGRAHYVRHNKVTRVPRTFVYLDSEAYQRPAGFQWQQTFRCAVAAVDKRPHHREGWNERQWAEFDNTADLWAWVDSQTHPKARTVLVAHKLDYDLRLCDGLRHLTHAGWTLEGIRLGPTSAWASWKRDTRTLVMCDSLSWVNRGLETIGQLLEMPKLPLPPWDDTDSAWLARCRRDVEILATFYRRLIDWVLAEDLGNWKPTGAGQAWAAFRHKHMTHRLLVHDNAEAKVAERRAGWTGRCEAWQHGKIAQGPFTEWDYTTQYSRIGAECLVPTNLIGEVTNPSLTKFTALTPSRALLAECAVSTSIPSVPTDSRNGIIWPVGTFTSTLWDTEIRLAEQYGAKIEITRMWQYARKPALRSFCKWCLSQLEMPEGKIDPIVRLAIKHWSRALIGRFAARYSDWEEYGECPWNDIALGLAQDVSAGESWQMLQLGKQLFRQTEETDSQDAVPSVMTWVMAEARCRLFRAAHVAGIDNVAYLDTDSLIVNRHGHSRLADAGLDGFRVKGQWNSLEVMGPRQLILAGNLRAAGVGRNATRIDTHTWEFETWDELQTSIAHGQPDRITITPRRVSVKGTDHRRIHGPNGRTYPISA